MTCIQQAYLDRLWIGAFRGIASIGPMLSCHFHRNTNLVIFSVGTARSGAHDVGQESQRTNVIRDVMS